MTSQYFWKYPTDPKEIAALNERTRQMTDALGLSREFVDSALQSETDRMSVRHPKPAGEIVWSQQSGADLFEIEKLLEPVLRGAGMRTHRIWRNGRPEVGCQWCYDLESAIQWATRRMEDDLHRQISALETRVRKLEALLAVQRFTPQPY